MREFYQKNGIEFSQEILNSFKSFDEQHQNLRLTSLVNAPQNIGKSKQAFKELKRSTDAGSNP
jgi:hypothetical protein